jgi:hypothetical protein
MYNSTFFLGEIAKSLNEISKKLDKEDNDTIVPEDMCNNNEYAGIIIDLRSNINLLSKEIKEMNKRLNVLETRINCLELYERMK